MDRSTSSISPDALYAGLGAAAAPLVIDVRRPAAFAAAPTIIVSAFHRSPDEIERWRASGIDARYLEDGIKGWIARKLPTDRMTGITDAGISAPPQ